MDHETRLNELNARVTLLEKMFAVRDVEYQMIEKRLSKIEGLISRLIWIAVGSLAAQAASFVLGGGLNIAP